MLTEHSLAEHVAVVIGKPDATNAVPVRLHSACLTGDLLGSLRCDCGEQLRTAVARIAALGGGARPLTVEEVVEAANVPKSSAYRILGEFAQAGVVSRVSGAPGGDRHELAESLSQHHHHHLVCDECGIVQDFQPSRQFEQRIEREVSAILAASGFEVTQHVFDVRGRCRECVSAR